jgi:hypothetical protein
MTHRNKEGCSRCPGIFIKGELKVRAVDRGSGRAMITDVDTELGLLRADVERYDMERANLRSEMEGLHSSMSYRLVLDLQHWYCARVALRKEARREANLEKSLFYYRVRRLVRMKRELDQMRFHRVTLEESEAFSYRYSDLTEESEEYRRVCILRNNYIEKKYTARLLKHWNIISGRKQQRQRQRAQEMEAVRARERQARLERRQQRLARKNEAAAAIDEKKLIVERLKDKIQRLKSRVFKCDRVDCHGRSFASQARLDIHMSLHLKADQERLEVLRTHALNKTKRDRLEAKLLNRVRRIRELSAMFAVTDGRSRTTCSFQWYPFCDSAVCHECDASPISLQVGKQSSNIAAIELPDAARILYQYAHNVTLDSPRDLNIDSPEIQSRFDWLTMQSHIGSVHSSIRPAGMFLELLSRHPDVAAPFRIPLTVPRTRIGCGAGCDVICGDPSKPVGGRISPIHAIIYFPMFDSHISTSPSGPRFVGNKTVMREELNGTENTGEVANPPASKGCYDQVVTIYDNSSLFGTYIVSYDGVHKVPTLTSGRIQQLSSGDLVCLGVCERGSATLSAVEASAAAVVFRVRGENDEVDDDRV